MNNQTEQSVGGNVAPSLAEQLEQANKVWARLQAKETVNPEELMAGFTSMFEILERAAVATAAIRSAAFPVSRNLALVAEGKLDMSDAEVKKRVDTGLSVFIAVDQLHAEEFVFTQAISQSVREQVLRKMGIDPNDKHACEEFLKKTGEIFSSPVNG